MRAAGGVEGGKINHAALRFGRAVASSSKISYMRYMPLSITHMRYLWSSTDAASRNLSCQKARRPERSYASSDRQVACEAKADPECFGCDPAVDRDRIEVTKPVNNPVNARETL